MQYTTKLNLKKPDPMEYVNVSDINDNMEILDSAVGSLQEGSSEIPDLQTNDKKLAGAINEVNTKVTEHLAESKISAHKAKNIELEDVDGLFVGTELETAMKELFTSVSNGKGLIGTAITDVDDSLIVPTNPTHLQLANLIRDIKTGRESAEVTLTRSSSQGSFSAQNGGSTNEYYVDIDTTLIDFQPSEILVIPITQGQSSITYWNANNFYYIDDKFANCQLSAMTATTGSGTTSMFRVPFNSGNLRLPVKVVTQTTIYKCLILE